MKQDIVLRVLRGEDMQLVPREYEVTAASISRLVHNETNIGLTRSLNTDMELARGEHIAGMDAHDISMPG